MAALLGRPCPHGPLQPCPHAPPGWRHCWAAPALTAASSLAHTPRRDGGTAGPPLPSRPLPALPLRPTGMAALLGCSCPHGPPPALPTRPAASRDRTRTGSPRGALAPSCALRPNTGPQQLPLQERRAEFSLTRANFREAGGNGSWVCLRAS
nr:actin cytoskeleton-regulatory complex protein PAN1-like isoform X2 [Taeniopygia guttata]